MNAAEHLVEAIAFGCTNDSHDHIGDHRREILDTAEPLVVRRVDVAIEPAIEDEVQELLVCCVAEDGRPVALLLNDEARAKLRSLLGPAPTPPGLDERALQLADHILGSGGEWTTGKAHRWVVEAVSPKPPIYFTRHALQALAVHGYLRERREPGRVSYTPNYSKDGG